VDRAHEFFERQGGKAIVLARFVPIVRTFVPFVAGVAEMSYPAFALYNVTGAVAWVAVCVGAGYLFGQVPIVRDNFSLVALGVAPKRIELRGSTSQPEHFAAHAEVSWSDLAREAFIAFDRTTSIRQHLDRAFANARLLEQRGKSGPAPARGSDCLQQPRLADDVRLRVRAGGRAGDLGLVRLRHERVER